MEKQEEMLQYLVDNSIKTIATLTVLTDVLADIYGQTMNKPIPKDRALSQIKSLIAAEENNLRGRLLTDQ